MPTQKTKTFLGLVAASLVALAMVTTFEGAAEAGSPASPANKVQAQSKPPTPPRPTAVPGATNIASKPVRIGDHWWAQFYDTITGENTGCHDHDNGLSCEGTCPCK